MPIGHYAYDATITFPDRGWQAVAYGVFVICLVVTSGILARRMEQLHAVFSRLTPRSSTWLCDILTVSTFLISFCFLIINGVLTFGIGTNTGPTCDASVVLCVTVFVLAKVLLYLYYLERLFLLNWAKFSAHSEMPPFKARFRSLPWLLGMGIFAFGVPCAILLGFSKDFQLISQETDPSEAVGCHVFLQWHLAIPIIIWAAILNSFVLVAFLWPLQRKHLSHDGNLRRICKMSIWSAAVSGVATVTNLSVLLILKGEHGIECLLCCSIDVAINSLVLAMISNPRGEASSFPTIQGNGGYYDSQASETVAPLSFHQRRVSGNYEEDTLNKVI